MDTSQTAVPRAETSEKDDGRENPGLPKGTLLAGIVTAIAASTCCIGPLVLLTLGVSGSWIGNLSAFEPYRPLFIAVTLLFLGLAFRKLYRVPRSCQVDESCFTPANLRRQRITFWVVSIAVLAVMGFPWYGRFLLD